MRIKKIIRSIVSNENLGTEQIVSLIHETYEEQIKIAWDEALKHSRLSVDVSVKEAKAVFDRKFKEER